MPSIAIDSGSETSLGGMFAAAIRTHPGNSGVQVVDTGREALALRLALVGMAERALDLQYYIWNDDRSGRWLAGEVLRAADRGVRVRLLLDDFNVNAQDGLLLALQAHPNIQVRIYNPNANRSGAAKWLALLGEFGRLNQRMHNKSFLVDDSVALVGGRNIGDEYFDLGETVNFRDRELFAAGPVVGEISRGFDSYWNSRRSYPIEVITSRRLSHEAVQAVWADLKQARLQQSEAGDSLPFERDAGRSLLQTWRSGLIWAPVRVLIDEAPRLAQTNSDERKRLARQLTTLARQARQEVLIESAYLVLGDAGAELLRELRERGVRVRALTNSLATNDLVTNHSAYARRRRQMLENGIELHELRPDAASCRQLIGASSHCDGGSLFGLHAKSIVFDRSRVFVGSFNLNLRSVYLNTELGLVVDSPELANRIADDIEANMRWENSWRVRLDERGELTWVGRQGGEEVCYHHEPASSLWRRLKSGLLSLLPIEKYL